MEQARKRAEADARTNGCFLNPDEAFLNDLFEGLVKNEERYGYGLCPCRIGSGKLEFDRDILCPCDYRDPDVQEYGCCYCAMYVRRDVAEGKIQWRPIPERRPIEKQLRAEAAAKAISQVPTATTALTTQIPKETGLLVTKKLWYCRQCGYVCYREDPPYICPICKAKREMFTEIQT